MKARETPPRYQADLDGCRLWRDGHQAVVSLRLNGRWIRILAADCRTLFHEELDQAGIKGKTWQSWLDHQEHRRHVRKRRHNLPKEMT